jgi:hypothetical protein
MTEFADPRLVPAAERLLALLPALFRMRDAEQAAALAAELGMSAPDPVLDRPQGPLTSFLAILGSQFDLLEAEVDALYEDQFIETCADWAVPYIGALVGARIIDVGDVGSARRQVANTISGRRSKGTARALATLAGAIANAPAEAIEYREFVATAVNFDFPRADFTASVALNGMAGRARLLPDHHDQHSWEVRDMREGGRFAYGNAGVRVWTVPARAHLEVVPAVVAGGQPGRLRFSPLNRDIALWRKPDFDHPDVSRLPPSAMPGPIPLADAHDNPGVYYGIGKSVEVFINGTRRLLADICFCDLSDRNAAGTFWNRRGMLAHPTRLLIDPVRGRMLLPGDGIGIDPASIRVRYHYGQAVPFGGGDFEQPDGIAFPSPLIIAQNQNGAAATAALGAALGNLAARPRISVRFGGTMDCPAATAIPAGAEAKLWSGNGLWPTLRITGSWTITGGQRSKLELRGLRLFNGTLTIDANGVDELRIADCTFDPHTTTIEIRDPGCRVVIERSIIGRVRLAPGAVIDITDSVIDGHDPASQAICAADGSQAGTLSAERSTFIGDVRVLGMGEVGNCLFAIRAGRTATTPPVDVDRTQSGCLRFSALPAGSRTPRRYRCYPAHGDPAPVTPVFASLTYGEAAYATLIAANPAGITLGAENGGEMGVMNGLSWQRRRRALVQELPEWVPFGMATATLLLNG